MTITTRLVQIHPSPAPVTTLAAAPLEVVAGQGAQVLLTTLNTGMVGDPGESAYQLALRLGRTTAETEDEWLDSLKGEPGEGGGGPGGSVAWGDITDKPAVFPPEEHDHDYVAQDDPRLSDARPPAGGAGGVLSGQYPNPGFAVNMATQQELNNAVAALAQELAGKQPSGSYEAGGAVAQHNTAPDAHDDIRQEIAGKASSGHGHAELHTHANKAVLDELGDSGGALTYKGQAVGGATSHSGLSGLGGDDHPQYALTNPSAAAVTYNAGGTTTITLNGRDEVFHATAATGGTTWAFTGTAASGKKSEFDLELTNGGAQTQTWPVSVRWLGGAPSLSSHGTDLLTFYTTDGGATWRGRLIAKDIDNADGFWPFVTLLMHMDGPHNSTAFADQTGKAVTRVGSVQISTVQSKFGGASAYFPGSSSYLTITVPDAFNLTGDFTVEGFFRPDNLTGPKHIVGYNNATANYWDLYLEGAALVFRSRVDGGNTVSVTGGAVTAGAWVHFAATRQAGTLRLFIDGVLVGSGTVASMPNVQTSTLGIGVNLFSVSAALFVGFMDELRITKGVARYVGAFTPPAAPFPG